MKISKIFKTWFLSLSAPFIYSVATMCENPRVLRPPTLVRPWERSGGGVACNSTNTDATFTGAW